MLQNEIIKIEYKCFWEFWQIQGCSLVQKFYDWSLAANIICLMVGNQSFKTWRSMPARPTELAVIPKIYGWQYHEFKTLNHKVILWKKNSGAHFIIKKWFSWIQWITTWKKIWNHQPAHGVKNHSSIDIHSRFYKSPWPSIPLVQTKMPSSACQRQLRQLSFFSRFPSIFFGCI